MDYIDIYLTNDGSVGLYNKNVQDIYHASAGAYTESMEKFILPANIKSYAEKNNEIKILDVCYGIGYNSKFAIEAAVSANSNIKITIDALEYDANLIVLSPLLKDTRTQSYIDYALIKTISAQKLVDAEQLNEMMSNKKIKQYVDHSKANYLKYTFLAGHSCPGTPLKRFLHNIYYQHVSNRHKKAANPLKDTSFNMRYHLEDARYSIQKLTTCYDFIFLDAFTPKLAPSLWTFEFFKQLYEHLNDDGLLLTYSNAIVVRSAMQAAGFCVGKNLNSAKRSIGTIAAKNKALIESPLSEYELGLLNTTAGIYYRDDNDLSLCDDVILKNHELEKQNSDKQTSSAYIKMHGKTHGGKRNV